MADEPTVQVPVSLIERLREALTKLPASGTNADIYSDLGALLSQPTPTAEATPRIECPRCKGYGVDPSVQRAGDKVIDCTRCGGDGEVTDLPRIDGMAPGTTFNCPERWTVGPPTLQGRQWAYRAGEGRYLDEFDPSTIRDVNPPATTEPTP